MLRSVKDVVDAIDAGRVHVQRFVKNAGGGTDLVWHDWSFASGQPAYDARIGNALAFKPMIAVGNDAIYFPPAPGMDRRLLEIEVGVNPGGVGQLNVEFHAYDIVGVYPLIDGDSTDVQPMDNTLGLPRYSDGAGVFPVLVNHVAPSLAAADMVVGYTNSAGVDGVVTWNAPALGVNRICYTTSAGGTAGPIYCALASADRGARTINSVQFVTPPGGLWAIYMCRPLGNFASRNWAGTAQQVIAEKSFMTQNALNLPVVKDGAWLGMFFMTRGSNRTATIYGNATFVWG
jgi:hypothetical protein